MLLGDLIYRVGAKTEGFEKGMRAASRDLNKLDRAAQRSMAGFNRVGQRLTTLGRGMTLGFSVPLAAAGIASTKFATDLNQSMANVATLIPGNTARVQELKGAVQEMAVDVGKQTGELTAGLYQVVSAFGDSAETATYLNINARAAAAGLSTVEEAVALTSAVTKGYGEVTAETVQKASDLAFTTVRLGQTTFPELAASVGRVVPIAAKLNVSVEEMYAGFATLTGVTGNTSEVSTQLAGVLRAMIKPTTAMKEAIANLGYASAEAMVQELGMTGALSALMTQTDGTSASTAKLFGRAEALNAVFALTGPQADTYNEKLGAMQNATGATNEAFKEQTEGINANGFALQQVAAQAEIVGQKFGDALAPMLKKALDAAVPLIDRISGLVDWFTKLPEPIQTTVMVMGGLLAAIGPVVWAGGTLITSLTGIYGAVGPLLKTLPLLAAKLGGVGLVGSLAGAKTAVMGLTAVLTGPVGLSVALGVALVGAIYLAHQSFVKIRGVIDEAREAAVAAAQETEDAMVSEADAAFELLGRYKELQKEAEKRGITVKAGLKINQELIRSLEEQIRTHDANTRAKRSSTKATQEQGAAISELAREERYLQGVERLSIQMLEEQKRAAEDFQQTWIDSPVVDEVEDLTAAVEETQSAVDTLATITPPALLSIGAAAGETEDKFAALNTALGTLGITSETELRQIRDDALAARDAVLGTDLATDYEKKTAVYRALKAQVEYAEKVGEIIPAETRRTLEDMKAELEPGLVSSVEKPWANALQQISTIITDFGKTFSNNIVAALFGGGEQRKKLEERRAEVQENLAEREGDYEEHVANINAELAQVEQDYLQAIEGNTATVQGQLADRTSSYEQFLSDAEDKERALRENSAEELAEALADLEENLEDRLERYTEYVEDVERKQKRVREDYEDNLDDERKKIDRSINDKRADTRRDIADAQTRHRRKLRDLQQALDDELRKGQKADQRRTRDIRERIADEEQDHARFLERKNEDLNSYIAEQNASYEEYVSEQKTRLEREEEDLQTSLDRKEEDHAEYVEDIKAKEAEIRENAATELAGELTDLQTNVENKTAEYERFKTDALKKLEDLNIAAKEKYEQQTTDLNTELGNQVKEFEDFKRDANAELEKIGKDAAGQSFFGKLGGAFKDMLFGSDGLVASLVRFSMEGILGTFLKPMATAINSLIETGIKSLIGWLTGDGGLLSSLGSVGSAIKDVFSGGVGTGGISLGSASLGYPGQAGGAAAGGIATGAADFGASLSSFGMMAGASAIGGAVSGLMTAWLQGKDLGRIEANTRFTSIAMIGTGGVIATLREFLPFLASTNEYVWGPGHQSWNAVVGHIEDDVIPILKTLRDEGPATWQRMADAELAAVSQLEAIDGGITRLAQLTDDVARGVRDIADMKAKVDVDVHFDGLVGAVARQVKSEVVAEFQLQRA